MPYVNNIKFRYLKMWLWQYLELKIILASFSSCQEIHVLLSACVWWCKHVKWKRQLTLSFHFVGFLNQIKNKVLQSSLCLSWVWVSVLINQRLQRRKSTISVRIKGFFVCLFVLKLVFFQNVCVTDKSSTSGLIQQQIRHWWTYWFSVFSLKIYQCFQCHFPPTVH